MKRLENLYDITKRLCGMIEPTGESNTDITRLANLEDTIDLVERLSQDIIYVARNKESYESLVYVITTTKNNSMKNILTKDMVKLPFVLIIEEDRFIPLVFK